MSAGWTDRDWEAWALEDPGAVVTPAAARSSAAEPPARSAPSRRGLARLAAGCVAFGLVAALAAALPSALPGEMPAASLVPHDAPPCAACPPSERLERVGVLEDGSLLRVNVLLAAAPAVAVLTLEFDGASGASGTTVVRRRPDGTWLVEEPASSRTGKAPWFVSERGALVVLGLPARAIRGVAVRTAGDRIPATGFVRPEARPARRANLVDALVVVLLLAAAAIGWRLGLAAAVGDALALAGVLVLTAILWRPLADLLQATARSGSANGALAVGLLVAAIGFAAGLMTRPLVPFLSRLNASAASGASRSLAAALAAVRTLVVVATLLAVADGLVVFGRFAPALRASALAGPLVDAVRWLWS
jgi:hypothetical protein